jgi:pimeloyl-ACP methyl ester carboxylesterase
MSKIVYREEGQGFPVLLLHGFCGSSVYWDAVVPLLAPHARLIVPDLPGHGQSAAPTAPYPIEAFAESLVELLDRLHIERAVWLGHSMGGYITLAAAERHADRIAAFGLIHSTAYPDDEKGKENRLQSIRTVREEGIAALVDGLIPKLFAPQHLVPMADRVEHAKQIGYGTSAEGAVLALEAMRNRPDRNDVLRRARCPVLLVAGENDQLIPPARTFSASGDSIVQAQIEQAGHLSMMEAPERLANVLSSFIQTVKG